MTLKLHNSILKDPYTKQLCPNSAKIATNLISRQKNVCWDLKFSSKSKLFVEGPSCLRTTFATLIGDMFSNQCNKPQSSHSIAFHR